MDGLAVPAVGPVIACLCAAKLGSITKAGDEDLRSLLVLGAATVLIRAKRKPNSTDPWVAAILKRRTFKVAAVALHASAKQKKLLAKKGPSIHDMGGWCQLATQ